MTLSNSKEPVQQDWFPYHKQCHTYHQSYNVEIHAKTRIEWLYCAKNGRQYMHISLTNTRLMTLLSDKGLNSGYKFIKKCFSLKKFVSQFTKLLISWAAGKIIFIIKVK